MAGESIEDLANEVATLKTQAATFKGWIKELYKFLLPGAQNRTPKDSRNLDSNSAIDQQTGNHIDYKGLVTAIKKVDTKIGEFQQNLKSIESRIGLQQEVRGAEAPPQSKTRTPLPTEPRTKEYEGNGGDDEDDVQEENDAEEENEAEGESGANGASLRTEQDPADPGDTFALEPDQLGERMPETLHRLSQRPGFASRFRLPWITKETLGANIEERLTPEDSPDVQFNHFKARQDGGMNIYRDHPEKGRKFEWPDFSEPGKLPTVSQAVEKLARVMSNPPEEVSYFNGIMESELYDTCPLYSGKTLAEIEALTHVNQIYTHLGKTSSATAMHNEDANLRSVNICFTGARLVIKVKTKDTKKFEDWVRANWKCKTCPQFVRHLNMFFGLEQLRAAGIEVETSIQGSGEGFNTELYQYHQVFNLWSSLAISTNYLAPGEKPTFFNADEPLEVCDECGLKNLYGREGFYVRWVNSDVLPPGSDDSDESDAATASPRQKRTASQPSANIKKRRKTAHHKKDWVDAVPVHKSQRTEGRRVTLSDEVRDVDERAERLGRMEEHLRRGQFVVTPTLNKGETMADHIVRLAMAIVSRDAIKQFAKAVKYSKRPPKEWARKPLDQLELKDGNPAYRSLAQRSKQMNETEERTDCSKIINRHDQLQFASSYQALRDKMSVDRLPSEVVDEICRMSNSTRQQGQDCNKEGKKWGSVCGKLGHGAGLLALIPCCRIGQSPFDVSSGDYIALARGHQSGGLQRFHELLGSNYVRSVCAAAEAWLKAVDEGKQFCLDDICDVDWDGLQEDEIVEQLKRLTTR